MSYLIDLHTHTLVSHHAYSTIHDYIRLAKEKGIVMFANTDHGPGVSDETHPWHFGNLKVVPRLPEGIAVLRGVEANFAADGSLLLNEAILRKLDIVLAGFHPNLEPSDDIATNTEIVMNALKSGLVDIWSHPGNPKYPVDYEAVLACAKENKVAVEINSSSSVNTRYGSHDNCVKIAKLAKKSFPAKKQKNITYETIYISSIYIQFLLFIPRKEIIQHAQRKKTSQLASWQQKSLR